MSASYQFTSAKIKYYFSAMKSLLFFAILALIVCQSGETRLKRRDASTFHEIGGSIAENVNKFQEDKSIDDRSTSSQKTSTQSDVKEELIDRDAIIREIFRTESNGSDYELFKNTSPRHYGHKSSTKPMTTSTQKQLFEVWRTTEGKLKPVLPNPIMTNPARPMFDTKEPIQPNDVIIFPDHTVRPDTHRNPGDNSPDCLDLENRDRGFCTKVKNYPDISGHEKELKAKFGSFFTKEEYLPNDISERMHTETNEQFLCSSNLEVIFPESAPNAKNNWKYVVQGKGDLKQALHYDKCLNPNKTCDNMVDPVLRKETYCKQTKIRKTFVVYAADDTFETETLIVPACCKCVITK